MALPLALRTQQARNPAQSLHFVIRTTMQFGKGLMAPRGPHPYMAQKRLKGLTPEEFQDQSLVV